MKIVGILVRWTLLCGSIALSNISLADVHGFKTVPWQDCVRPKQCQAMQPKEWSTSELFFLSETLNEFKKNGLSHFLAKIQSNNILTLERATAWYSFGPNPFQPVYAPNNYIHAIAMPDEHSSIVILDKFFSREVPNDPITGVDFIKITLLHELAHAFDSNGKLSSAKEFYEEAGFVNLDEDIYIPQLEPTRSSLAELARYQSSMMKKSNFFEEAEKFEREFGMKIGLPRLYSASNPAEAFADLVAYIYFDPKASGYISKKLLEYIDNNVLDGARNYE